MTDSGIYDIPFAPCKRSRRLRYLYWRAQEAQDDCLIWPFWKNSKGYGRIQIAKSHVRVHRLVCFWFHGKPPTEDHQAAHLCGNSSCFNPKHLAWKTQSENELDKLIHGTYSPLITAGEAHASSKLTESDVRSIRVLVGDGYPVVKLAKEYGVSETSIYDIKNGRTWGWLDDETA